jgi:hypothetical protein
MVVQSVSLRAPSWGVYRSPAGRKMAAAWKNCRHSTVQGPGLPIFEVGSVRTERGNQAFNNNFNLSWMCGWIHELDPFGFYSLTHSIRGVEWGKTRAH